MVEGARRGPGAVWVESPAGTSCPAVEEQGGIGRGGGRRGEPGLPAGEGGGPGRGPLPPGPLWVASPR